MKTKLLFPFRYKRFGWMMLIPSTIVGVLNVIFDFTFSFLDSKVFTLYSSGFFGKPSTVLGFIDANYTPTIAGILFIAGALLVAFSKEKQEDEFVAKTRLESLVWAVYVNYFVLALCFLFFYNQEFFMVMIFNMFTILIFFIIRFYYLLYQLKKSLDNEK